MSHRLQFLKLLAIGAMISALLLSQKTIAAATTGGTSAGTGKKPIVVSTWEHGMPANAAAWQVLRSAGTALDTVEQGVRVPEADTNVRAVGLGGYPNSHGKLAGACTTNGVAYKLPGRVAIAQYDGFDGWLVNQQTDIPLYQTQLRLGTSTQLRLMFQAKTGTTPSALNQVQLDLQFADSKPSFRFGQLELLA